MFQELKEVEPGVVVFECEGKTFRRNLTPGSPWKFAMEIAYIVEELNGVAEAKFNAIDNQEDFVAWEAFEAKLTRLMADAFWYATQEYNRRDNCGRIHRATLIQMVRNIYRKENASA